MDKPEYILNLFFINYWTIIVMPNGVQNIDRIKMLTITEKTWGKLKCASISASSL